MDEAAEKLRREGIALDLLRIRAFPFHEDVAAFIAEHDKLFVLEQNRDGQLRTLLINELEIDPAKLIKLVHYDGSPITARFISFAIAERVAPLGARPARQQEGVA